VSSGVPLQADRTAQAETVTIDNEGAKTPVPGAGEAGRTSGGVLRKLAATPDRLRRLKILRACARFDASWADEVLWESLGDPCEEVRDGLVRELSGRASLRLDLAASRLARPPWYARSAVLLVLARRKTREGLPLIAPVVGDANADVRRSAARALGEIGGKEVIPLLIRLSKDVNPYVRAEAEAHLERIVDLKFC
jgi:HEAT repeats